MILCSTFSIIIDSIIPNIIIKTIQQYQKIGLKVIIHWKAVALKELTSMEECWCYVDVLGHWPKQWARPLLTLAEYLKQSGIMKQAMLDRSLEEFIKFKITLVPCSTRSGTIDEFNFFV